jgi:hypothetical protein
VLAAGKAEPRSKLLWSVVGCGRGKSAGEERRKLRWPKGARRQVILPGHKALPSLKLLWLA